MRKESKTFPAVVATNDQAPSAELRVEARSTTPTQGPRTPPAGVETPVTVRTSDADAGSGLLRQPRGFEGLLSLGEGLSRTSFPFSVLLQPGRLLELEHRLASSSLRTPRTQDQYPVVAEVPERSGLTSKVVQSRFMSSIQCRTPSWPW